MKTVKRLNRDWIDIDGDVIRVDKIEAVTKTTQVDYWYQFSVMVANVASQEFKVKDKTHLPKLEQFRNEIIKALLN